MTAPSAPEGLLSREEIEELVATATPAPWQLLRVDGDRNVTVYGPSAAIVAKSCGLNDARLLAAVHQLAAQAARAADLAQNLEAAERERDGWRLNALQVRQGAQVRLDRAEATLAAAQEAMREKAARYVETRDWWSDRAVREKTAAGIRALPLPTAAKPEGA